LYKASSAFSDWRFSLFIVSSGSGDGVLGGLDRPDGGLTPFLLLACSVTNTAQATSSVVHGIESSFGIWPTRCCFADFRIGLAVLNGAVRASWFSSRGKARFGCRKYQNASSAADRPCSKLSQYPPNTSPRSFL
jgi:hypothetical protein